MVLFWPGNHREMTRLEESGMKFLTPEGIAAPASCYSHGALVPGDARRLIVSGQIGIDPDGTLAEGLDAQMERCWLNLFAVLESAGMTKRDLVKITVFVTQSDAASLWKSRAKRPRSEIRGGPAVSPGSVRPPGSRRR
jgi:enamine deaminase RidA (YjgF/YER057c/UK114 family)